MPNKPPPYTDFSELFVGLENKVPLLNGSQRRYYNFDNSASTPPLKSVQAAINQFAEYYSSVHRGTGYKSQISTHLYEEARRIVMEFFGAHPDEHVCIFGKNTTEAINKLARRYPFTPEKNIVITSGMEHHSNDLPWRAHANAVHVRLHPDGRLDLEDFDTQLEKHADRIALVAISGASNVTGFLNPIHDLAEKAHAVGAQIFVDCAQLAPHRSVDMLPLADPRHLDYIAISAHKLYAPYGTGALIGRRDTFERGEPDMVGGGVVEIVTLDSVEWAEPPDRDEAGSPNSIGVVALAVAIKQLDKIGMQNVAAHEIELTQYALENLPEVPGITLLSDPDPNNTENRLGVIPFNLTNIDHFKAAAVLGYEFGIGVRNGCFCAHPLILHILGLSDQESEKVRTDIINHDKSHMPGLIRASFGLYNSTEEIDVLIEALTAISRGSFEGNYIQDKPTGEYSPENWNPEFDKYVSLSLED
ncbi:MAG: aminotransferase class V-fold PLP-dependent enzyme [Chloroflexota bacterium]